MIFGGFVRNRAEAVVHMGSVAAEAGDSSSEEVVAAAVAAETVTASGIAEAEGVV